MHSLAHARFRGEWACRMPKPFWLWERNQESGIGGQLMKLSAVWSQPDRPR
jgi:hypothetical protein